MPPRVDQPPHDPRRVRRRRLAGAALVGGLSLASGVRAQEAAAGSPAAAAPRTFDVNEFIVRGNTTLPALDIEKAVYPFEGPGRTLADVNAARDALQKVYQDRGYQSVVVELPQQQVKDGVILLQVSEAKVGRLRVQGAKYNSPLEIRDAVPALAEGGVPDFNQAQAQLSDLNRSADRQVIPVLKPGVMPQTVDVDLKVDDHSPLHGSLELNNDKSPGTSLLRTTATLSYSNLWQLGHVISGTYVIAPQHPSDARVYAFSYLAPLKDTHWSFLATVVHSDSNVASVGGTNVLGKGTTYGFTAIYALPSSDTYAQNLSVEIDHKHYDEDVSLVGQSSSAPLTYVPVTVSYTGQMNLKQSQTSFSAALVTNIRGLGSSADAWDAKRFNATPDFIYGKFDINHTQTLKHDLQANAHVSAQIANSPLVSSEQFSAGGMNSVRGYMQAEDTGDSGVIGSLELRSPSLAKYLGSRIDELRFHAFVDAAHLWLLSPLPEQTSSFNLLSVGLGMRMQVLKYASADFEAGFPLKAGIYTRQYSPRFDFYVRLGF
ncbi:MULTISPECIES: ShlB/FhaC/HecB family hemolysin secretion/activation protein [unclassified Burkholderia]|uniref:ShlB/FhaC/HecB family hemolysin secretion/activation protein n=1 Tax=unclassified Burkholderia TaxID=2613784 RepID=UPI000469BF18|nr:MULTISPECIES: ShlB/FhaC/HecB family hemolysin secretion/activation protein [unclassified Burkholderia]NIE86721.1 ShlB/FhaC/HecB family hemolysin secretion/activation protein [Burkholderia sp. Tr-860]NIF66063.1 ShlB/FhaC/HecB family hemolysin secretion/activation protein [Burkholderia sp. Cy-647]NIF99618.1 ShlB/FhaC/HecB family hemolysin secretion/activation protein [Burkholderia sp. Ax-1720]